MSPQCHLDIPKEKKKPCKPLSSMPLSARAQVLTTELQRGVLHSLLQALHGLHQLLVKLVDDFFQETRVLQPSPESKGVIWRKRRQGRTSESSEVLTVTRSGPDKGDVPLGWRHRVCKPTGGAAGKGPTFPILCHTQTPLMLQNTPLLRAHHRSKKDLMTPLILRIFFLPEMNQARALCPDIFVLNNIIPR